MGISSLGYILIESTELEPWRHFACQVLGLMDVSTTGTNDDAMASFKMDAYPYRIRVLKGNKNRFLLAGWEVESEQRFDALIEKLTERKLPCRLGSKAEAKLRGVRKFAKATDPTGTDFEFFYGMQLDYESLISPVGVGQFVTGHNGDMGLGHIAISTPDLCASHDFYRQTLGFGQTDYMHFRFSSEADDPGQGLHFLHADNPRHHSLALFEDSSMPSGSMIHLMLEVPTLDDLGLMMDRVKDNNINVINPIGKHTNDEMVSIYVESPAGFAIEYGFGGRQLDWQSYRPTESAKASIWGHSWTHQ